MSEIMTYLRCARDHPNAIPMIHRNEGIGRACTTCGQPLLANVERERPPMRRY